jgi:hypothetical protein
MLSYRRFERNLDEDLDSEVAQERTLRVRTIYSGEVVTSFEDFAGRFPDARERDLETVKNMFITIPNLYLTIVPIVG